MYILVTIDNCRFCDIATQALRQADEDYYVINRSRDNLTKKEELTVETLMLMSASGKTTYPQIFKAVGGCSDLLVELASKQKGLQDEIREENQ